MRISQDEIVHRNEDGTCVIHGCDEIAELSVPSLAFVKHPTNEQESFEQRHRHHMCVDHAVKHHPMWGLRSEPVIRPEQ